MITFNASVYHFMLPEHTYIHIDIHTSNHVYSLVICLDVVANDFVRFPKQETIECQLFM